MQLNNGDDVSNYRDERFGMHAKKHGDICE